ncbi:MAG: hypothetical protein ACRC1T_08910 [Clostridium chrysemydis]|uniref:hypothetical protein n=1 Tax=Clostridium chrysemydis TaxID=2665504 RepID=UPI003F346362
MIITGQRQVGKTHRAIKEIINRYNFNTLKEKIGIISRNLSSADAIKRKMVKIAIQKHNIDISKMIYIISIRDIPFYDHVLFDEIDIVFGKNVVGTVGRHTLLTRTDENWMKHMVNMMESGIKDESCKIEHVELDNEIDLNFSNYTKINEDGTKQEEIAIWQGNKTITINGSDLDMFKKWAKDVINRG